MWAARVLGIFALQVWTHKGYLIGPSAGRCPRTCVRPASLVTQICDMNNLLNRINVTRANMLEVLLRRDRVGSEEVMRQLRVLDGAGVAVGDLAGEPGPEMEAVVADVVAAGAAAPSSRCASSARRRSSSRHRSR